MTSLINPSNIDITFPVAGQDNDTQGFRTNYQNIKNNFSIAATEITGLQSNVITLQSQIFSNANVSAYLPYYTGNISAGNLNVTSITYTNQEVINTSEVIAGNVTVSGNLIVSSVVGPVTINKDATITGNLITNGARVDASFQYYAPTTNFYYIVNTSVYRVILDPTGAITNGTVVLPSANVNGTVIRISSTQTVTNLQVLPNTGCTLVPSANITLNGGTAAEYLFHLTENKWYKV